VYSRFVEIILAAGIGNNSALSRSNLSSTFRDTEGQSLIDIPRHQKAQRRRIVRDTDVG
jgi:hypothetical protein